MGKDELPEIGWFSAGIHPWYVEEPEFQFEELNQIAQNPRCLAIGECGLDKLRGTLFSTQKQIFRKQIELGIKLKKPLIIHCVKAFDELFKIRQEYSAEIPWVVHGFNQKMEIGQQLLKQNFFFSLGKALDKPDSNASKLLSIMPLEKLFLETDEANVGIETIYHSATLHLGLSERELVAILQANFTRVSQIIT